MNPAAILIIPPPTGAPITQNNDPEVSDELLFENNNQVVEQVDLNYTEHHVKADILKLHSQKEGQEIHVTLGHQQGATPVLKVRPVLGAGQQKETTTSESQAATQKPAANDQYQTQWHKQSWNNGKEQNGTFVDQGTWTSGPYDNPKWNVATKALHDLHIEGLSKHGIALQIQQGIQAQQFTGLKPVSPPQTHQHNYRMPPPGYSQQHNACAVHSHPNGMPPWTGGQEQGMRPPMQNDQAAWGMQDVHNYNQLAPRGGGRPVLVGPPAHNRGPPHQFMAPAASGEMPFNPHVQPPPQPPPQGITLRPVGPPHCLNKNRNLFPQMKPQEKVPPPIWPHCQHQHTAAFGHQQQPAGNFMQQPAGTFTQQQNAGAFTQQQPAGNITQQQPAGTFTQQPNAGTFTQHTAGTFNQQQNAGMFSQQQNAGTFNQQQNVGTFNRQQNSGTFSQQQYAGGFKLNPTGTFSQKTRGSLTQQLNVRGLTQQNDAGVFTQQQPAPPAWSVNDGDTRHYPGDSNLNHNIPTNGQQREGQWLQPTNENAAKGDFAHQLKDKEWATFCQAYNTGKTVHPQPNNAACKHPVWGNINQQGVASGGQLPQAGRPSIYNQGEGEYDQLRPQWLTLSGHDKSTKIPKIDFNSMGSGDDVAACPQTHRHSDQKMGENVTHVMQEKTVKLDGESGYALPGNPLPSQQGQSNRQSKMDVNGDEFQKNDQFKTTATQQSFIKTFVPEK